MDATEKCNATPECDLLLVIATVSYDFYLISDPLHTGIVEFLN